MTSAAINLHDYPQSQPSDNLRLLAETRYIVSDVSLVQLIEEEPFKGGGIHRTTLERWCMKYSWVRQRDTFREKWKTRILNELGNELVEAQRASLKKMIDVQKLIVEKIMSDTVKPKSLEGLVNSYVRLSEQMIRIHDEVSSPTQHTLSDERVKQPPQGPPPPKLTFEENLLLAKLLIDMRKKAQKKEEVENA